MQKPLSKCLWLAVALLVGGWPGLRVVEAAPRIVFERTVYDFGTTSNVQSVTGSLRFSNDGNEELRITNVTTTCACTHVGLDASRLKPGESSSMAFSIALGPSVGQIYEQVFLSSNDPSNPTVTLTLTLYVKPIFAVTPVELNLGDLAPGSTTNVSVRVERTDGRKLQITKVESETQPLSTRVVPVKESKGHAATVLIRYKAGDQPGAFQDIVRVYTGEMYAEDIPKPSFEFQMAGRIVKPSP